MLGVTSSNYRNGRGWQGPQSRMNHSTRITPKPSKEPRQSYFPGSIPGGVAKQLTNGSNPPEPPHRKL
jgi:hypothetical protein